MPARRMARLVIEPRVTEPRVTETRVMHQRTNPTMTTQDFITQKLIILPSLSIPELRDEADTMCRMLQDGLTQHSNDPKWKIGRELDGDLASALIQHMKTGKGLERIAELHEQVKSKRRDMLDLCMDDDARMRRGAMQQGTIDPNSIKDKPVQDEDIRLICNYAQEEFQQIETAVVLSKAIRAQMTATVHALRHQ